MITKIYLDMDGVLADFDGTYISRYNEHPKHTREKKLFSKYWHDFVNTKQFENLELFSGAKELMSYVDSLKVPVEILSSSGGELYHKEVEQQKLKWLKSKGINYKANIVINRKAKAPYADNGVVLIDDTQQVIDYFNEAGGIGILHKTFGETKEILQKHLKDD